MSNGESEQFEITILGKKFTATMLAVWGTVASTIIGVLWAGFQVWHKIDSYVAPDIDGIEKRLILVEETSTKTNDYTRDIKNDLKSDIRKLEALVEQIERQSKQLQRETYTDIRRIEKDTDEKIKKILTNPLAEN
jgi:hypothetical protein